MITETQCARIILDANFQDNSVMLFTKLGWLPTDDIICTRKLYLPSTKSVMAVVQNIFCPMLTMSRVTIT